MIIEYEARHIEPFLFFKSFRCEKKYCGNIQSVMFSPYGNYALSSGNYYGAFQLWDMKTGKELRSFFGHRSVVNSVIFSPNGRHALSGSLDGTVRLWDIQTANEIRTFGDESSKHLNAKSVSFSPDGNYALSAGGAGNRFKLWDVQTGKELRSQISKHLTWHFHLKNAHKSR